MDTDQFIVRFWGTRGSYPAPGPKTIRYGGNTTCLELQISKHVLVIDAGTGIINLGHDLIRRSQQSGLPIVATIFLTHMHHDHTQGFPYFPPAHIGSSTLHILGPRTFDQELEETLNHAVLPPSFPVSLHEMPSFKIVRSLHETEMVIFERDQSQLRIFNLYHDQVERSNETICVRIHKSYAHPRNGVYIYRVEWRGKSIVFATDTEGYVNTDQRLVKFAKDTDLLIHDAQYTEADYTRSHQGWGHSTPQMACDVAKKANVKRLVLFHHEPMYSDDKVEAMEKEAQGIFPNTLSAYEGLELII